MPPRAKITKEMVIDAAFEVAREAGGENINARTVAKKLNCSTQPVMYHFATIEELNMEQTKDVFITLALFVHGYASIIVNNALEYDEELIKIHLERAYKGAILAIQEEMK